MRPEVKETDDFRALFAFPIGNRQRWRTTDWPLPYHPQFIHAPPHNCASGDKPLPHHGKEIQ
jgi:hypothetical protein